MNGIESELWYTVPHINMPSAKVVTVPVWRLFILLTTLKGPVLMNLSMVIWFEPTAFYFF